MKKRMLFVLLFLFSLAACGKAAPKGEVTTAVTWEELLAANRLETVLEQVGGFSSVTEGDDGEAYIHNAAMADGELIYSGGIEGYTEDLQHGILFHAPADGMEKSITIIAPTADLKDLIDGAYGEALKDYQPVSDIYINEGQYFTEIYQEDKEWGTVTEGYAYFDAETLLLDHLEMVQKIGSYKSELIARMTYPDEITFPLSSYDAIVNAEDIVDLTIHYPDETTTEITVDRNVTVSAYYPDHEEQWSVCRDKVCTGSVDDLGWISGSHGDIYLCEGDVAPAPPSLNRVLKQSAFDSMFEKNYDTYFQSTDIRDQNDMLLQVRDLAWYVDEEAGLCLNLEIKDAAYTVIQSGRARDLAWYSWTKKDGYAVDFFDEFSYAENLIREYRLFLSEERLKAPMMQEDAYLPFYIPYEETVSDGSTNAYKYWINPDSDYIDLVEITQKDSIGNITGLATCYIGGNGPIPGDLDIFTEIAEPADTEAVQLTVISPAVEKTYSIRKDAAISWKGNTLYKDEACTKPVTDLQWITGHKGTVYVK